MNENIKKHEVRLKLSAADWQLLQTQIQQSTCRSRTEFLHSRIFGKTLLFKYRNVSLDACTEELTQLKEELKTLSYHFESAFQKLRTLSTGKESAHWLISYDLDRRTLLKQVDKISSYLQKFSENDWHYQ